ncbi:MAG: T9SS type A sorting domain-containing protein [Lewinellaceae bacterium]|nr:T9SS type A sorting domain-containing protein [Lewinellaceae bacterium]
MLTIKAAPSPTSTLLSFTTASERNNAYFAIERSTEGTRWVEIGQVAGAGNSSALRNYSFTDAAPMKGVNYYRLRQVDFDGKYSLSPVVTVVFGETIGLQLFPNPTSEAIQVRLEEAYRNDAHWNVFDRAGRLVMDGSLEAETTDLNIPVFRLPAGMYVLRLASDRELLQRSFIKE